MKSWAQGLKTAFRLFFVLSFSAVVCTCIPNTIFPQQLHLWTGAHLQLIAVLCIVVGPTYMSAMFSHHRSANAVSPLRRLNKNVTNSFRHKFADHYYKSGLLDSRHKNIGDPSFHKVGNIGQKEVPNSRRRMLTSAYYGGQLVIVGVACRAAEQCA
jgi:hypothetical protein